ncbi:hypothetical protein SGUI_1992 [Serinicoccus hydrothermalis]|uniref:Tetratricopeptide repeat protein n=1 Tax=Serinicoccus hydrothermalis TaxID=1758689 RepID=A0A1B1ND68_9MICO|nr:hypothetical protein [Serinicoccus hydrothermalis]ANS79388.1 hypothetical protein SGUI_1992 [Serinicoccus hydrothermalis]
MIAWDDITAAIGLALSGEGERGAQRLRGLWEQTRDPDHAQRCVLAHYLADLEAELDDEVAWDERALAEYPHVRDEDLAPVGIASAAGLAPSLHLNLGDGYLRQGQTREAQAQLDAGLASADALPDDGYGAMIRQGLLRLADRVAEVTGT